LEEKDYYKEYTKPLNAASEESKRSPVTVTGWIPRAPSGCLYCPSEKLEEGVRGWEENDGGGLVIEVTMLANFSNPDHYYPL